MVFENVYTKNKRIGRNRILMVQNVSVKMTGYDVLGPALNRAKLSTFVCNIISMTKQLHFYRMAVIVHSRENMRDRLKFGETAF